eukprot:m.204688 g.204688  ORF g.204688 m.204688 type:complete len:386 (+) comp15777_c0_seq9:290-1447(+)
MEQLDHQSWESRVVSKMVRRSLTQACQEMSLLRATQSHSRVVPRLSVAPMLDWTDRHFRYMARLLTKKTHLYTEMVADNALLRGKPVAVRRFGCGEEPASVQLGGSVPATLGAAAKLCVDMGYKEINLNVGCPSSKGQDNCLYGVVLMRNPQLVSDCMSAICDSVPQEIPCTVKCRLGVDDDESYEQLCRFIHTVHTGTRGRVWHFIIHARKAILDLNLSPKQNRNIPPLKYDIVYKLVKEFPHLKFTLNGGVKSLKEAKEHLRSGVHGVMIGRAAYKHPLQILANADREIFGIQSPHLTREDILAKYIEYMEEEICRSPEERSLISNIVKPAIQLFSGVPKVALFRQVLEAERKKGKGVRQMFDVALQIFHDNGERKSPAQASQ